MKILNNIFSIIVLIGAVQGIFISFIIFFIKKGNKNANRTFSVLIFATSISVSTFLLYSSGIYKFAPFLVRIYQPLQFIFGPLLLLYSKFITDNSFKFKKTELLHFIPFIISILVLLPFFIKGYDFQLQYAEKIISGKTEFYYIIFEIITTLYMWIYIFLSFLKIKKYQTHIKNNYSALDKINLEWLKIFLIGLVIVYTLFLIPAVMMIIGYNFNLIMGIITITGAAGIFLISYVIIARSKIFTGIEYDKNPHEQKYKTSPLKNNDIDKIWNKLSKVMMESKLYLNPNLTLKILSENLNTPRQYISQIINKKTKGTFYDYVNQFRIDEFKRLIQDSKNKNFTILALAYDSGFNSKATFNSFFKKSENITPSQYLKKIMS